MIRNGRVREAEYMGDLTIQRAGGGRGPGWELLVEGTYVMPLTFEQSLQVIRGELDLSALRRGQLVAAGGSHDNG